MFTESLTVRILGDSSGLRSELDSVVGQLAGFRESLGSLQSAGKMVAEGLSSAGDAVSPLQQVSRLVTTITQQLRVLGQTPVTINVAPALTALQRLLAMIEVVAARLRMLTSGPAPTASSAPGGTGVSPISSGESSGQPSRAPTGVGYTNMALSTPALDLFSGLHRNVSASPSPLQAMSEVSHAPARLRGTESRTDLAVGTTNHFGGITIHVREAGDINGVVRDLRLQGIHLRNRRG